MKKKLKKKIIPAVLALGFLLTGCGGTKATADSVAGNTEDTSVFKADVVNLAEGVTMKELTNVPMTDSHSKAMSRGAVQLLIKSMELGGAGKNYLISPVSLEMAFGMLVTGADEGSETEKEVMELLLPGEKVAKDELNGEMASLAGRMKTASGVDWNVVNSIWVKKDGGVKLKDSYISDAVNYYNAELYSAPFDQSTVDEINTWVKKNTKERIPTILESLDAQSALVLVNALAFDGAWTKPVEDYVVKKKFFTNADGTESKVSMMLTAENGYVQMAGGKGFLKPYEGGNYSFLGLLPPEGVTAEEYLSKVLADKKSLAEAIKERDYEPYLDVEFPEFKAEYGADMNEMIRALGANKIFSGSAEFGKMITEDSERISVDQVVHKTMIDVNRKGTKAAAATAITATEAGLAVVDPEIIEIHLNRPFVYGIIDMTTGLPVFLGVQNTMK